MRRKSIFSSRLVVAALMTSVAMPAWAIPVTRSDDTNSGGLAGTGAGTMGDLRYAILNTPAGGSITFVGCSVTAPCTIMLGGPMPPIEQALTIDGGTYGSVIIDGGNSGYRALFVDSGLVAINNLIIQNVTVFGGSGGSGTFSGGGGLGAGAGLWVNQSSAQVTVTNTFFNGCSTYGGSGGYHESSSGGGGGGLAFGGSSAYGAAGGGVQGAGGTTTGTGAGGSAYGTNSPGGSGGFGGPNGGAGGGGGGGGGGGFGGGGSSGGNGGFGGGGAGGAAGGVGGFGGGGAGSGGFGGSAGGTLGGAGAGGRGGGGGAAGACIFVNQGMLTVINSGAGGTIAATGGGGDGGATGTADANPVYLAGATAFGGGTGGSPGGSVTYFSNAVPVTITAQGGVANALGSGAPVVPLVPTLTDWWLAFLGVYLAIGGFLRIRRQEAVHS